MALTRGPCRGRPFAERLWEVRSHLGYLQPGGAPGFQRFCDEGRENSAASSSSPSGRSMWEPHLPGSDSWPFVLFLTPWAVRLESPRSRGAEE